MCEQKKKTFDRQIRTNTIKFYEIRWVDDCCRLFSSGTFCEALLYLLILKHKKRVVKLFQYCIVLYESSGVRIDSLSKKPGARRKVR